MDFSAAIQVNPTVVDSWKRRGQVCSSFLSVFTLCTQIDNRQEQPEDTTTMQLQI